MKMHGSLKKIIKEHFFKTRNQECLGNAAAAKS